MNNVSLIGRLCQDPIVRYTEQQLAIARFSIAINRMKGKNGEDKGADFINIVVFGKTAENCEKFLAKGRNVAIQGHIQTGSYTNKENQKVYTTDVVADRVEFIDWGEKSTSQPPAADSYAGFQEISDEDIPF